jgi:hypothetical protein
VKGDKTGLPVEQPAKFELVINPKASRALLGFTISPSLRGSGHRMIKRRVIDGFLGEVWVNERS